MLDEQQDASRAVLNEDDIRRMSRIRRDRGHGAVVPADVAAIVEVDTPHRYHRYPTGVLPTKGATMSETATYRVPGMGCGHCERAVSEELTAVAGVESVAIDLDSKLVQVTGESLDDGALRSAIVEAGFEAE